MAGTGGSDQEPPPRADVDPQWRDELEAMTAIGTAVEKLDPQARERVLAWTLARYGFKDR